MYIHILLSFLQDFFTFCLSKFWNFFQHIKNRSTEDCSGEASASAPKRSSIILGWFLAMFAGVCRESQG